MNKGFRETAIAYLGLTERKGVKNKDLLVKVQRLFPHTPQEELESEMVSTIWETQPRGRVG